MHVSRSKKVQKLEGNARFESKIAVFCRKIDNLATDPYRGPNPSSALSSTQPKPFTDPYRGPNPATQSCNGPLRGPNQEWPWQEDGHGHAISP